MHVDDKQMGIRVGSTVLVIIGLIVVANIIA